MRYFCKCGLYSSTKGHIVAHVALMNPNYPRSSTDDDHKTVTEAEYHEKRNAAYRRLKDNPTPQS